MEIPKNEERKKSETARENGVENKDREFGKQNRTKKFLNTLGSPLNQVGSVSVETTAAPARA
jgi:hypothetical protein